MFNLTSVKSSILAVIEGSLSCISANKTSEHNLLISERIKNLSDAYKYLTISEKIESEKK